MNKTEVLDLLAKIRSYLMAGNPVWDTEKIDEAITIAMRSVQKDSGIMAEEPSMNDYIKRRDAIEALCDICEALLKQSGAGEVAKARRGKCPIIKAIPAADVVEVVRCKNCKHHEELLNNNDGNVLCWVHGIDVIVDANGYCSYGERKEQEHERGKI